MVGKGARRPLKMVGGIASLISSGRNDGGVAMTWSDSIVDEVRRVRDAYAARFNYDLRAIYRDLKEQEERSGRRVVSYAREFQRSRVEQVFAADRAGPNSL